MNKKLKPWLPAIINAGLTVLFAVYYAVFGARLLSTFIQLAVCAFVPAIFPVMGLIFKKPFSPSLSVISAVICLFDIQLAKGCNLYGVFTHYDKFLHTSFGLFGSAILYALMLRWNGNKMNVAGQLIFVFLGVLGVGALWEILEYVCSWFTGEDPQRYWWIIDEAIATGKRGISPLQDTMQDLIVTAIGSFVFILGYLIDKQFIKGRLYEKAFSQPEEKTV